MPINFIYLIFSISRNYLRIHRQLIHPPGCLIIFATKNITFFVPDEIIVLMDGYIFFLFSPVPTSSLYNSTCFRFSCFSCWGLSLYFICDVVCLVISAMCELFFCTILNHCYENSIRIIYFFESSDVY